MNTRYLLIPTLALATLLGACATSSPDVVRRSDAQRQSVVYDAVLLSIRNVKIDGSQSGAGAVTGGNTVERANTGEEGEELLLQFSNGERRTIVQGRGQDQLRAGDAVIVIQTGNNFRVVRAPARAASGAPAPAPAGR